jgi:tetratricopeptide (TPR) repeat protein
VAPLTSGWWFAPTETVVYSNPYFVQVPVPVAAVDYSQPIPVPAAAPVETAVPEELPATPQQSVPPEVSQAFGAARAAFRAGDFAQAQALAEQALAKMPGDPALHEFRALTLFAQGKYRDAAAALFAVLSAGPGWDWETLKGLYPDTATYTAQLRALETYHRAHRDDAAADFVMAYHYLVIGQPEVAANMLDEVIRLKPEDQLAAGLLRSLRTPRSDQPAPQVIQ